MSHSEVRDLVLLPSAAIFITYVDVYKLVILSSLGKHLLYEGYLHYNNLTNPPTQYHQIKKRNCYVIAARMHTSTYTDYAYDLYAFSLFHLILCYIVYYC